MFLRWFRKRRDLRYLLWPQKQQRCQGTPQLSEFEFARVSSLEPSSFRLQRCVASAGSVTVACVVLPALNKTLQPAGPPPSSENTYWFISVPGHSITPLQLDELWNVNLRQ